MVDLLLYETGNGGDLLMQGIDLAGVYGIENMLYMAMFGGDDWFGNALFQPENPYQCRTEKALNTVTLNSAGRVKIQQAVDADLAFLKDIPGTTLTTSVTIASDNKVKIVIALNGKTVYMLWDPNQRFLTYKL